MGLCFCSRPSMGMSPSDDERHPLPLSLSTMPAAPRPARLPRLGAGGSPIPPSTPPRAPHMHDGASSPRQSSMRCPIPKIPDFEGLAESETDSDDELLQLARLRAAGNIVTASPVPSTPISSAAGAAEGTSLSPLSSLISRIGNIGRTSPSRPANICRTSEAACSTDDLAAAAHRAEVRRLMHKMMQDDLQSEQQQQQQLLLQHTPRTYKRSSMSTIKEDPGDVSGVELDVPHSIMATLDGSGPHETFELTFTKSKEDMSLPSVLAAKEKNNGKFTLPKPPALPAPAVSGTRRRGLGMRGRARVPPIRGLKDLVPSLSTDKVAVDSPLDEASSSAQTQSTLPQPLSGSAEKAISPSTGEEIPGKGSLRLKRVVSVGESEKGDASPSDTMAAPVSGSLSSMDDDGSIHEAREARVISSDKFRSASDRYSKADNAATKTIGLRSFGKATTGTNKKNSLETSTSSRVSTSWQASRKRPTQNS
ncbi:hypothetical protein SEUCBS140593_000200 [Sporothrix eucalyptigena]|uniref:Uncharacterized protein n=1 Tax=Sporothrix eucalyptigena TaxID=1812306 RepID=A0ABP0AMZ2_9PEZI